MTKNVFAEIKWLSPIEGGRKQPPRGPTYTTVARFEEQGDQWTKEAWSLVAEFLDEPDRFNCQRATVRFLVEEAPWEWLTQSSRFDLMEGDRVVARGVILES